MDSYEIIYYIYLLLLIVQFNYLFHIGIHNHHTDKNILMIIGHIVGTVAIGGVGLHLKCKCNNKTD